MRGHLTLSTSGRLLAAFTLAVLTTLGVLSFINMNTSEAMADRVLADVKLTRLAGFADMMHDALRADVLAANLAGLQKLEAEGPAIRTTLNRHASDFERGIADLEAEALDADVRNAIATVKPMVLSYVAQARHLLEPSLAGQASAEALVRFDRTFDALTGRLDDLSHVIEASAARSVSRQAKAFHRVRWTTGAAILFGGLVLCLFTAYFVRTALRRLGEEPEALRTFSMRIASGDLTNQFVNEPPAQSVADAMQRMQGQLRLSQEQLLQMARHDALTGLPNRLLLEERLGHAITHARRHNDRLTVAFIDLDNFKDVNDNLGHDVGDELLVEVSRRMVACTRSSDMVVRLGGDEFVVLLSEARTEAQASDAVLQRLQHAVSEPLPLRGYTLRLGCSIGLARFPEDGSDGTSLLKKADVAMYRAKELGKNNVQSYTAAMGAKVKERLAQGQGPLKVAA